MSAQLMALYGDKPILIIVPKTLIWQWQDEMNTLLDMPSAVWNGKEWVDENGFEYPNQWIRGYKKMSPRDRYRISRSNRCLSHRLLSIY